MQSRIPPSRARPPARLLARALLAPALLGLALAGCAGPQPAALSGEPGVPGDLPSSRAFDLASAGTRGRSALSVAAMDDRLATARQLLDSGADPNAIDPDGRAPLLWAAQRGHVDLVELLVARGASVEIRDRRTRATPLIDAAWADQDEAAQSLLDAGASPDVSEVGRSRGTALHVAVLRNDRPLVERLLAHGADPTVRDGLGRSALQLAQRAGRSDLVAVMEEHLPAPTPGGVVVAEAGPPGVARLPSLAPVEHFQPSYRRRVGAVIGIDRYLAWPSLEGARGDAERFAATLRHIGFDEVVEVYDEQASRARILRLLGDELAARTGPDDLVVVFFAGHGYTETLPDGEKRGYVVPADAAPDSAFSTAISMATLRDLSARLPAKHVYYAMDSCYSGLGLARGIAVPSRGHAYLDRVTSLRAVQMLTAGAEGEQVYERGGQGLFTTYLIRAIQGQADADGDGAVTASEIGAYVQPQVAAASDNRQTPQFGTLDGTGEVVFAVR